MIISIKSERDFYVPTVFGDLMNHWQFQIATEARLEVRCCLGKTYIVRRVAIWTARPSQRYMFSWVRELQQGRESRQPSWWDLSAPANLSLFHHGVSLDWHILLQNWHEKGGKLLVPATSVTLKDPGYSSLGKVLARTSAVASYTERMSHCTAVYDGRVLTLELVHLSGRRGR